MKFLILALFLSNFAYSAGISPGDQPSKILKNYSNLFVSLPLAGKIQDKTLGWPGGHWPSNLGSISHRWSANDPEVFTYSYRSLQELRSTPQYLINAMSPAEKLSIYQRDYSYKLVDKIRSLYSSDESDWHGICHGVAAAQMNHGEPQKKTVTNRDGIKIEFYSSDLKGLISYYYANVSNSKAVQAGLRCHSNDSRDINCQGINPATFHLVLANKIGLDKKPFIADIDHGVEVWNQVAIAFSSYIVNEYPVNANADSRAVKMLRVQTEVTYESTIQPTFGPVIGTNLAEYLHYNYEYYLEIDSYGDVIGGQWISDLRTDFLFLRDKARFKGSWADLLYLYNPIRL